MLYHNFHIILDQKIIEIFLFVNLNPGFFFLSEKEKSFKMLSFHRQLLIGNFLSKGSKVQSTNEEQRR